MDGCLFHFCQATLNRVRKNGLEKAYEKGERDPVIRRYNPSQVRVWVRRLQHLAFVPIDDVPSAFTSLSNEIPSELCFDDFLDKAPMYMEKSSTDEKFLLEGNGD